MIRLDHVCNSKFGVYVEVVTMGNGKARVNANYLIQGTYLAKWSYNDF